MTEPFAVKESPALREIAYRRLREAIVECRLAPGQRLTERRLATDLGLGISPIREALTRLDHEGFIRTLPRKGYQVKPLTIKSVDDLFEFWTFLCPELVRRSLIGATDTELERIIDLASEKPPTQMTPGPELTARCIRQASKMFDALADATHNEHMVSTQRRLNAEISRVWSVIIVSDLMQPRHFLMPENWIEVLRERDGDKAAELARQYIRASHDRVLAVLARWPSVVTSEVVPLNRSIVSNDVP